MLLTKSFPAESYRRGIEAWDWVGLGERAPVLASLFGDVFLRDAAGYWFLDLLEGTLDRIATTRDELQALLDSEDGQDRFLLGGLAMAADRRGLRLQLGEVYAFRVPPALGGRVDVENMVTLDFVVALHITGQVHRQLRNRAPGAAVNRVIVRPRFGAR